MGGKRKRIKIWKGVGLGETIDQKKFRGMKIRKVIEIEEEKYKRKIDGERKRLKKRQREIIGDLRERWEVRENSTRRVERKVR